MTVAVVAYIFTACLFSLPVAANSGDILTPQNPLADDGLTLVSEGSARFELGFFSPAAGSPNRYIGIWYHNISDKKVVWVANRRRPLTARTGRLSLTTNGTLVLTQGDSTVIWSSTSPTVDTPVARLLDDGNFVVAQDGGLEDPNRYAWQSFEIPTDMLLPGMKLGWNLRSRVNRNLTSWTSDTDPAPGIYTLGIDVHGDAQLFMWNGTRQLWRAGPWNGLRFSGIPQMETGNVLQLSYDFVIEADEVAYSFRFHNPAVLSMLVMNHTGVLQRLLWAEPQSVWMNLGSEPSGAMCDGQVSPCGPNSVCRNDSSACGCLQGFRAKTGSAGTSGGCVRETALKCNRADDSFVRVSNAKLPDTAWATVNWRLSMSLDDCKAWCSANCSCTAYASANISGGGNGTGCIIWTGDLNDLTVYEKGPGQDLYVRQAAADFAPKSTLSLGRYLAAIIGAASILAICLALLGCWVWRRKRTRKYSDQETEAKDLDLPIFDLSTVAEATCNFSINNKLGQGGFGPVYKGTMGDGNEIAVKRLSKTSSQGVDEFKNEVLLIAKLQHRNLVRLLGCCIQGGERMLIYEYMPNGSLDSFLFDGNATMIDHRACIDEVKGTLLDWRTRYNIIVGIARGLLYLHHDSRLRIIHRDLKASNVLLDKDMNPKISDFGMARIFASDDSEVNTAKVVGTYGYMSPEYAMDGIFSVKSDVFSFGVLVLEIISGKRNRGVYHLEVPVNLLGLTWSLWREGKALEIARESFEHSVPAAELLCCIKIGLLCVQERPGDRPTMITVVKMLDSDISSLPEPNQPGFIDLRRPSEMDSSGSKQTLSVNSVTMTTLEVR